MEINEVTPFQLIMNSELSDRIVSQLGVAPGEGALDGIIDVFYQPSIIPNRPVIAPFRLHQFLLRYHRTERLVDGKKRTTLIGRSRNHLLTRALVPPPGDLPLEIEVGDQAQVDAVDTAYVTATGVPVVTDDYFRQNGLPTEVVMSNVFNRALTANPTALAAVTNSIAPGANGLLDHALQLRYENSLLLVLKRMSDATAYAVAKGFTTRPFVDFSLRPTGTASWELITHPNGLGLDRRLTNTDGNDPVVLAAEKNNLTQPVSIVDRIDEVTDAYVAGSGSKAARDIVRIIEPDRIADSPWNRNSRFLGNSKLGDFATENGVPQAYEWGISQLSERGMRRDITAVVQQTNTLRLGGEIGLGDQVNVSFDGDLVDRQISRIDVSYTNTGGESVGIDLVQLDLRKEAQSAFESLITLVDEGDDVARITSQDK